MEIKNRLLLILFLLLSIFNTVVFATDIYLDQKHPVGLLIAASNDATTPTETKEFILAPAKSTNPTGGKNGLTNTPKPSTGISATSKIMTGGGLGGSSLMACDSEATPPTCYCHTISECIDMESECKDPETIKCKPQTSNCSCVWKSKTGSIKPTLINTDQKNSAK